MINILLRVLWTGGMTRVALEEARNKLTVMNSYWNKKILRENGFKAEIS